MKGNKIIAVLAAAALWLPAGAQEAADSVEFNPHWFVGAHAGAQYTLGEAKFGDLLSPTVQLSAGYRFTPWLSVRLSVEQGRLQRVRDGRTLRHDYVQV